MRILVPFKRVQDTAAASGDGAQWVINPFDELAIEEALRMKERGDAQEVVAVTIGTEAAEEQLRSAMAMGVDRAMRVEDSRALDPYAVARILAGVVRRENPGLVIMGKQAVDDDANQVGQMLGGLLGWAQATFISQIELIEGGTKARCTRETDRGLEVLMINLPAVVTADLRLNEPRYVSLPGLMKARRRSIEVLTGAELGVSVIPRTTVLSSKPAPKRSGAARLESVEDLVGRLRQVEKVL